jgi:predicted nucleic acid-binding protein
LKAYFDTGILVKNYCNEANSRDAISLILAETPPLPLTPLQEAELRNVFRLKVFRGERSLTDLRVSLSMLDDDLREGRMERMIYDMSAVHRKAEALSEQHTCTIGTRTLDILHVAAALEIGATRFVSFDQRQRAIAKKAGLKVLPKTM